MTKQASIAYISGLMDNPSTLTDGDQGSISGFRQSFPYFIPARYLDSLEKHKEAPFSPAMLSAIQPYMGDWMLFCDFMNAGAGIGYVTGNTIRHKKVEADVAGQPVPVVEVPLVEVNEDVEEVVTTIIDIPVVADAVEEAATGKEDESEVIATQPLIDEVELPELQERNANNFWTQGDEGFFADGEDEDHQESIIETPAAEDEKAMLETPKAHKEKPLISPVYTDDYFLRQGEKVPTELPEEIESLKPVENAEDPAKSLMVMMSFTEWLLHFKHTSEKQKEENKDQRALKTMWQKEKLAAAIEEENEEIPENVFEMAVNSITKEDGLSSESLAEVYVKQGKYDKAIDMYRKLSLRNPQKNAYFALKIEEILKEKLS